jgi:hypothetical protein
MAPTVALLALAAMCSAAAAQRPPPGDAAGTLSNACALAAAGGDPCARNVSVPTGAAPAYRPVCTPKCCVYNCGRFFPCSACSAAACGETCVSVPVALTISYRNVSICELARNATGDAGGSAPGAGGGLNASVPSLEAAAAQCPCLSKAAAFAAAYGDDVLRAKAAAVAAAGSVADCLATRGERPAGRRGLWPVVTLHCAGERQVALPPSAHRPSPAFPRPAPPQGLNIKNDSAAVRKTLRAASAADVIFEAPPIDTAFYTSVALAAVGCGAAAGATCDTIPQLFLAWFQTAVKQVGQGMADYLRGTFVDGVFNSM